MQGLNEITQANDQALRDAQDVASTKYPAIVLPRGNRLHVCRHEHHWQIWLNTEAGDFDGLCIGAASTRDRAVAFAVGVLESALEELQKPAQS